MAGVVVLAGEGLELAQLVLSSSDSGRQAARMASTLGATIRFDPRRVRIPVLPIDDQRAHGAAFRRLADLARALRAAHDEGNALVRDLIDATVSSITAAPSSSAESLLTRRIR